MIASVLSQKYNVLKTEGNFNNETVFHLRFLRSGSSMKWQCLRLGISEFGEMHRLAEMAYPDIMCDHKYRIDAIWKTC